MKTETADIPFYHPHADEVDIAIQAANARLPVMIVGPTGSGKTRFIEHVAAKLARPLITIVGNDDTTTADLVGRFLVKGGDVTWVDGPLTRAVRSGAVCYLDEVVEVRREALAVLHPLADDRRELFIDRTGEAIPAADGFLLICSYNPSRSVGFKELRVAFRTRFITLHIDYLPEAAEALVVCKESDIDTAAAERLVRLSNAMRKSIQDHGGDAPSTRMIIQAAKLMKLGVEETRAKELSILNPLIHGGQNTGDALRELMRVYG